MTGANVLERLGDCLIRLSVDAGDSRDGTEDQAVAIALSDLSILQSKEAAYLFSDSFL
jgi:hypothetical protein